MTTAIIILNWNNFEDTDECLGSLYRGDLCGGFIVLVDNGSQDGSYEKLRQKWSYWKAIHWIKNKEILVLQGETMWYRSRLCVKLLAIKLLRVILLNN